MPDDPFASWDAAYVLGALSPEERAAFEEHLENCPSCSRAVQQMAGMPGLLSRADLDANDEPPAELLPTLLRTAGRERRRRLLITGGGWAAAAAASIALVLVLVLGRAAVAVTPAATPLETMSSVNGSPLTGQVGLVGVAWGTKIELKCTYPEGFSDNEPYVLVVHGRAQTGTEQIGSWKLVPGHTATMNASTNVAVDDIASVEVRSANEQVLVYNHS